MRDENPKPNYKHLLILKTAIENKLGMKHSSVGGGRASTHWFRIENGDDARPEFPWEWFSNNQCDRSTQKLLDWGWTTRLKKHQDRFLTGTKDSAGHPEYNFAWYEHPYGVTKRGREYWEAEGKDLFEQLQAVEDAKRAEVERLVIASYRNKPKADRNAVMLLRVVRETARRLYVEVVKSASGDSYGYYNTLEGSQGTYYIAKEQVWRDNVTESLFDKIVAVENGIVAEKTALRRERDDAIQKIRQQYADRETQQSAQYEGLIEQVLYEQEEQEVQGQEEQEAKAS